MKLNKAVSNIVCWVICIIAVVIAGPRAGPCARACPFGAHSACVYVQPMGSILCSTFCSPTTALCRGLSCCRAGRGSPRRPRRRCTLSTACSTTGRPAARLCPRSTRPTTNCSLVRLTDGLSNKTDYTCAANNNGRMDRIYAVVGTYTVKYETYKVCEQAALFRFARGIAQRFTR